MGPMCRSMADAAIILNCIAGPDSLDEITLTQPQDRPDYTKALKPDRLQGVRLGVPRRFQGQHEDVISTFNDALETMKELGATIIDPADFPNADIMDFALEKLVLETDFKVVPILCSWMLYSFS